MQSGTRVQTIGVFTPELSDGYEAEIWRAIEERSASRGYGVISFLGLRIGSPVAGESAANVAYELATERSIDGLVIISAAIATYLDAEKLAAFFHARQSFPRVSIGVRLPGASSVIVNASSAIGRLARHLIEVHGRRHFAIVGGPAEHAEVKERRRAIVEALACGGLQVDERLDFTGRWLRSSGAEAAATFIESGVPFDAVVCMNDKMAIGVIRTLRARGIRVPEEVSVVGFDGIPEGRELVHPLTTVVQPLSELGAAAVDTLAGLMGGGPTVHRVLECSPAIRESCGCPPDHQRLFESLRSPGNAEGEASKVERLVALASNGDREAFVGELTRASIASILCGEDPSRWNGVLLSLRSAAETGGSGTAVNSLLEVAGIILGEMRYRDQTVRRAAVEERFEELRSISASLAGSFEIDALFSKLLEGLLRLGIGEGFVALLANGGAKGWARLVLTPQGSGGLGVRFRVRQLLPAQVGVAWRAKRWVLEPLVFQDEPLGYMLLPGGYDVPALYDSLRGQISSALKGALLLKQVRSHERTLENEVRRRTREITRANRELKEEVRRRVRLESEVVDISNRTMERIGQDLHDDLCQHLAGIAMLASVVEGALGHTGRHEAESLRRIGELLEDSIARVKQIARGLIPTGLEAHGLPAAIEALVENARKSYPVTIDFRASPAFTLADTDRALQIYRIVQEALSNAVKHSGSPHIVVTLGCADYRAAGDCPPLVAEVRDSGSGVPSTLPHEGMGLRIMRYRAEKAGLELCIEPANPGTRVICRIPQDFGKIAQ